MRDLLGDEAEGLLQGRVASYNVRKSLYDVVEEMPLAMCDATSQLDGDMLRMELKYRERMHRWVYLPHMQADQVLLFNEYDLMDDDRVRFVGHATFKDPTTPPDAKRRESIEVRTMAFF